MSTNQQPSKTDYTKYAIGVEDRILFDGRHYDFAGEFGDDIVLRTTPEDTLAPRTVALSYKEIARHLQTGRLAIEVGYNSVRNALLRTKTTKIFELDPDILLRARMVSEFLAAEADVYDTGEKYTRSDASIKKFIACFKADNQAWLPSVRGGQPEPRVNSKRIVGPRQFRRLIERFEKGHHDPRALAHGHQGKQPNASKYSSIELQFHQRYAARYQSEDKPSMLDCWHQMLEGHAKGEKQGKATLRLPSLRSFQRLIREQGDFANEIGRSANEHRIIRRYSAAQKGLKVTRPLQIVEMDEHKMDMMRLLVKNGIWDFLHPDVQARIEDEKNGMRRVWLSVALDAYSRSVCGLKILFEEPNAESGVATLAMVARNKDRIAALAGSASLWPQCGTPEDIHTDAGAAYVAAEFQAAAMAYTGRHVIPASKHPHLRGRVERFFRSLNQRYIHLFSGQTFSNSLLRDGYDSEKNAHIDNEQLAVLLVRLIVDCYHNTPQKGLYGLTPLKAWYRGTHLAQGAVRPEPTSEEYGDIFGITDTRKIADFQIDILGLHYASEVLSQLGKQKYRREIVVRINELDLSAVSVKHPTDNKWISVPAVFDGLKNVTMTEWVEVVRHIKRHFGDSVKHSAQIVRETIAEIREISEASRQQRGVGGQIQTVKELRHFENQDTATFRFSQREAVDTGADDTPDEVVATSDDDNSDPFDPGGPNFTGEPKRLPAPDANLEDVLKARADTQEAIDDLSSGRSEEAGNPHPPSSKPAVRFHKIQRKDQK